jgi:hypothetical protein
MRNIALVGLLGFLLLPGCRTNMTRYEAGNADSAHKVLIAGEATAFKQAVVDGVIEKLGTRDWYFRVVGLDQLEAQETETFGAILLVAGYRAGRLDERVIRYLAKDPTNPRVVLFFTRGSEDPMPEKYKPDVRVDAVSSASREDRVESRAQQLADLLRRRF